MFQLAHFSEHLFSVWKSSCRYVSSQPVHIHFCGMFGDAASGMDGEDLAPVRLTPRADVLMRDKLVAHRPVLPEREDLEDDDARRRREQRVRQQLPTIPKMMPKVARAQIFAKLQAVSEQPSGMSSCDAAASTGEAVAVAASPPPAPSVGELYDLKAVPFIRYKEEYSWLVLRLEPGPSVCAKVQFLCSNVLLDRVPQKFESLLEVNLAAFEFAGHFKCYDDDGIAVYVGTTKPRLSSVLPGVWFSSFLEEGGVVLPKPCHFQKAA